MAKRRITLRHVEAFHAVIATGSMTEASRKMHTSQPQVSRMIGQLENIIDFQLFHRNGTRLSLTVEGQRFSQEVEKAFAGLRGLEEAASRIRSFSESRLTVAAMPRLASGLLPRAVALFKQEYPDVTVAIHSGDATSVHAWISSGFCNMGVAMLYSEPTAVEARSIRSMDCVAVLPKGHDLVTRDCLYPSDFDGEPFIAFPSGSPLRNRVDAIFDAADCVPVLTAEASLGASICALVAEGLGMSLINPLAALEERMISGLELRPFDPKIPIDIVLLYPERAIQSRLVETFSAYVADVVNDLTIEVR